jgi:hypothetical protein
MATGTAGSTARQYHTSQVHYLRKKITYAIENTEIVIGTIPPYASVCGGGVHILTAFDDTGTDTLDVGFKGGSATDDPNGYATLLDLSAVGRIALDELTATTNIISTNDVIVTCIYNGQNNNATAGVAYVEIQYTVGPDDGS